MSEEVLCGGCSCGEIRYEIAPTNSRLVVCHCTSCQKQSASAYGLTMIVPSAAVSLTSGTPKKWTRTTDSGNIQDTFLCGTCGTRIWHGNKHTDEMLKVRAGALDTPVDVSEAVHIWTNSKLPGIEVPEGAKSFPQNPS